MSYNSQETTAVIYSRPDEELPGIPPEVFEYRLGNRLAVDWIIAQYQFSTDKRSGVG